MAKKMSLVVFSGTADRLQAAATIAAGAAAMGVETHIFLTFWGLTALRASELGNPRPLPAEYGAQAEALRTLMQEKNVPPWHEILRQASEIGDVHVHACAMTADLMGISKEDLDPMVEDVIGVGRFIELADDGQVLFI